jgi:hypothetical protein
MVSEFLKQLGVCPICEENLNVLGLETNENTHYNVLHTKCKKNDCGAKWDISFKLEEV